MLLIVYSFNWLDRQILGILAPVIKTDLGLTNTQLGALGGIAFAMLYSTLAIPLAVVADRTSRSWVITIVADVIWSGFTALCGMATGFWHLFAVPARRWGGRGGRRRAQLRPDLAILPA
jgi:sugar phosphate permease